MPSTRSMKAPATFATRITPLRQSTIEAFGHIGKAGFKKTEKLENKNPDTFSSAVLKIVPPLESCLETSGKKHTLEESDSESEDEGANFTYTKRQRTTRSGTISGLVGNPQTPRKQRCNPQTLPTPETTPTKVTEVTFEDLPYTPSKSRSTCISSLKSPPASSASPGHKHEVGGPYQELPDELQDLIQLHSALLKALSLHLAHNGSASPVNVAHLCPMIGKIWRVRNVTLDDIKRVLGVANYDLSKEPTAFRRIAVSLQDYSGGNICLEWPDRQTKLSWQNTTEKLNRRFKESLTQLWMSRASLSSELLQEDHINTFIDGLPLAATPLSPSLKKTAPLFSRGQRRLDEFHILARDAQMQAKQPAAVLSLSTSTSSRPKPHARASSLMDRLLAKKAAALESNSPTKPELQRQAALFRLPELVAILTTLRRSNSQQRQSHTLQSLVRDVQNSARSPMSKEEVEASVRLLATEVAAGGVRIIDTGAAMGEGCAGKGITAVVVDWPTAGDLSGKVRRAIEASGAESHA